MSRHLVTIPILLLSLFVAACERGAPWSDQEEPTTPAVRTDFGPTAAYDRRMIFLGLGDALPTAAVFDFQVLSDSAGVRRGVRARAIDGEDWLPLMDAGWEMAPMREPWRLVPHGPLRISLSESAELDAIEVRDDPLVRLQPGDVIAEHAPDAGTQLVLREAALVLDQGTHTGILLDAQLGRSVGPGFLPRLPRDTGAAVPDDSAASPASPTARPGTEALLLDTDGFYLVIAGAASGQIAWVHSAGQDDVRNGVLLRPATTTPEAAAGVPGAWQMVSPAGAIVGELRTEAGDRADLEDVGGSALELVVVSGWVEDRSVRRQVFGLVRHIR